MIPVIDDTHDPARRSWVASANGHADFPIQNLPLGVFSPRGGAPRCGVAIGDFILDLSRAAASALMLPAKIAADTCTGSTLNAVLGLSSADRLALRRALSDLLKVGSLAQAEVAAWLHPTADCTLHLPARIGDYTDFYAGIEHARNVGRLYRPDQPLLPNYKHIPIGYHGRASSVRPSGTPVRRPSGQRKVPDQDTPTFGPSRKLDIELELGLWVGRGNRLGEPIAIGDAGDHIAGLCLLNDWSARDFQTWEYQPLGPFLAKNFLTTVSPWIVTAEALAPFRVAQPPRADGDPRPLPYLSSAQDQAFGAFALTLEVHLSTEAMRGRGLTPLRLSSTPAVNLYWTPAQLVAHHTSGGCDLNPGDLLGTGTISTPDDAGLGSLLEITRDGRSPIQLPSGEERTFLQDGDEVTITGRADAPGFTRIGFGVAMGTIASVERLG